MTEHPFSRIPEGELRLFVVPIASASLVLLVVILELVQRGPGWLPFGDLVLSFTSSRATEALSTWSVEDRVRVAFINGLDYLFGPLYANLLAWVASGRVGYVVAVRVALVQPSLGSHGSCCCWTFPRTLPT